MCDDIGNCFRFMTQRTEQLLGQIGSAMAWTADNHNEAKAFVKGFEAGFVACQQRGEQFIGTVNRPLSERMRDDRFSNAAGMFDALVQISRNQFFRDLVMP